MVSKAMGRRFRKATIDDVAAHAGVSKTTISRFLRGNEGACSSDTARRIRGAVEALHYAPAQPTRGLCARATHTVGVCLTSPFDAPSGNESAAWFFGELWRGVSEAADEAELALLHYARSIRLGTSATSFLDGRVDGLLFNAAQPGRVAAVAQAGLPVVMVTRSADLPPGCGAAFSDEDQALDLALSHLWSLGHRRIAHLGGPEIEPGGDDLEARVGAEQIGRWRRRAFTSWMHQRQLFEPGLLRNAASWSDQDAALLAAAIWHQMPAITRPTAVVCANDELAGFFAEAALRLGWRVPEQVSIVGIDNRPGATTGLFPALSSVEVPLRAVGREAMNALVRLMAGEDAESCRVRVRASRLVERASTAPPPGAP